MSSEIEIAIARYRNALLAREQQATIAIGNAYRQTRATLLTRIEDLANATEGRALTPGEIARLDRAQELLKQVETEMSRLAAGSQGVITRGQTAVIDLAESQSKGLAIATAQAAGQASIAATIGSSWNRLNTGAVEAMVGRMSDGSPLREWMAQFGPTVSAIMEQALPDAIGLGRSPRDVAKDLADLIDGSANRMLAHARTQILGSYRDASLKTFAENADVLDGWIWTSAHQSRTCLACLSLDGTLHPLTETFMKSHVSCRCSPRPKVKGVDDPAVQTGTEWFHAQSEATQRDMIPVSAWDEFAAGALTLEDFTVLRHNERWGDAYIEDSVDGARDAARARRRGERRAA